MINPRLYKMIPPFLSRLDEWLLLNHSLIWRTRVHFFVFYGAIANILMYLLGWLLPINIKNIPTANQISLWVFIITALNFIIFLLWLYDQIYNPQVKKYTTRKFLLTTSVYGLILSFLFLMPLFFVNPIILKIAHALPDELFYEKYNFHKKHDFWQCTSDVFLFKNDEKVRNKIVGDYELLDLDQPIGIGYTNCDNIKPEYIWLCDMNEEGCEDLLTYSVIKRNDTLIIVLQPCLITGYEENEYNYTFVSLDTFHIAKNGIDTVEISPKNAQASYISFQEKMNSILNAKSFFSNNSIYFKKYAFKNILNWFLIFVFVGGVITGFQYFRTGKEYSQIGNFLGKISSIDLSPLKLSKYVKSLDKYLVLNHPIVWASQIHKFHIIEGIILTFLGWVIVRIISSIIKLFLPNKISSFGTNSTFFIIIGIIVFILIFIVVPNIKQISKQKGIRLNSISEKLQISFLRYVYLSFLPYSIMISFILGWQFYSNQDRMAITFGEFFMSCMAIFAYISITIANFVFLSKYVKFKGLFISYFLTLVVCIYVFILFQTNDIFFKYEEYILFAITLWYLTFYFLMRGHFIKRNYFFTKILSLHFIFTFPFLQIVMYSLINDISDYRLEYSFFNVIDNDLFYLACVAIIVIALFLISSSYPFKMIVRVSAIYPKKIK